MHVGIGLSALIIFISIDNVPTLNPNKYSLNNLPTQFNIDMMYIDIEVSIDMNQMLIYFE